MAGQVRSGRKWSCQAPSHPAEHWRWSAGCRMRRPWCSSFLTPHGVATQQCSSARMQNLTSTVRQSCLTKDVHCTDTEIKDKVRVRAEPSSPVPCQEVTAGRPRQRRGRCVPAVACFQATAAPVGCREASALHPSHPPAFGKTWPMMSRGMAIRQGLPSCQDCRHLFSCRPMDEPCTNLSCAHL